MHAALPVASPPSRLRHLGSACHALAELTAVFLPKAVADGSLFELDAASFSMVLAQDKLVVASESAVLEHALRWASRAGRTEEVVSRVMPLVRFPLVSLLRPSAALKRLQQGNAVVAQLIKEALALQVKPASAVATFVPTRHRLIDARRHRRRAARQAPQVLQGRQSGGGGPRRGDLRHCLLREARWRRYCTIMYHRYRRRYGRRSFYSVYCPVLTCTYKKKKESGPASSPIQLVLNNRRGRRGGAKVRGATTVLPYSVSRVTAKRSTQVTKSRAAMPFVAPAESRWCRSWIS